MSLPPPLEDTLKWVLNPICPLPQVGSGDLDALYDLVQYHRIGAALLARLEDARPTWCPPRFLTRLRVAQHHVWRQTSNMMAAAREATQAMRKQGLQPAVFIKGFAGYALTADPLLLHRSADLDPFAADLPAFWDVAHALGYQGKRKDTHEWAKLSRGAVTMDVHQHYPVMSYPENVRLASAEELRAASNPGQWCLSVQESNDLMEETHIRWDDVAAGAVPGVVPGTEELHFPAPETLCLLHCAHCLRNSMTRLHYMNSLAESRVYELLCIRALSHLPAFSMARFAALRDTFAAHDAVHHVNVLAKAFCGAALLPEQQTARGDGWPLFPEHLLFGGWVSLQGVGDYLEVRNVRRMLQQIGVGTLPTKGVVPLDNAARLLFYGLPPVFGERIGFNWDTDIAAFTLEWRGGDETAERELLVHFGYGTSVCMCVNSAGRVTDVRQKSDYFWSQGATAERVYEKGAPFLRLTCPLPALPKQSQPEKIPSLPLLIAARSLSPNSETAKSAWYLPLVLQ